VQIDHARIILTGAASGIGLAVLNDLARYAARISSVDLDRDQMSEAIGRIRQPYATIMPSIYDVPSAQLANRRRCRGPRKRRNMWRAQRSVYSSKLVGLILLLDRVLPFTRRVEQRLGLRKFEGWQAQH
jgi:NAD(P)-dependent dehydrogenase (short-subunit alcohol dehydrogenase family)